MAGEPEPEKLFALLEKKIHTQENHIEKLCTLSKHLESECFDEKDRATVLKAAERANAELLKTRKELDVKRTIYENHVKRMEVNVKKRKIFLEKFDKKKQLFKDDTELLEYFVNKQNKLKDELLHLKKKIIIS